MSDESSEAFRAWETMMKQYRVSNDTQLIRDYKKKYPGPLEQLRKNGPAGRWDTSYIENEVEMHTLHKAMGVLFGTSYVRRWLKNH